MKILLTNEEMKNSSRPQVFFSVAVGSIFAAAFLCLLGLVALFLFHMVISVSIKIYLAVLIAVLLFVAFRVRSKIRGRLG
jgi:hypothetical protein